MATFNKSEIFKSAWSLVKTAGKSLSEALKAAWVKAKKGMTTHTVTLEKYLSNFSTGFDLFDEEDKAIAIQNAMTILKKQSIANMKAWANRFIAGRNLVQENKGLVERYTLVSFDENQGLLTYQIA